MSSSAMTDAINSLSRSKVEGATVSLLIKFLILFVCLTKALRDNDDVGRTD